MKILGIDLGGTNVRVGLVQNNELVSVESKPISAGPKTKVLSDIYELIEKFGAQDIAGIGVGVPSVLDPVKGIVYDVQNIPSWREVRLKDLLESKYQLPVYINNDANCFAAGEKYFGKGKNYNNIVGLIMGTGLGAGLIINGKLYSGANCGAGEFGMIPYKSSILEDYCCGQFFRKEYSKSGEDICRQAEEGNADALNILSEFGFHVGEGIKVIMYSIDPEIIILGGSASKAFRYFEKSMRQSVEGFAYRKTKENIEFAVSEIENIAILGAAALYLDADYADNADERGF
jgi:glucokinase